MDPQVPHRKTQAALDPELEVGERDRALEAAGELGLDLVVEEAACRCRTRSR